MTDDWREELIEKMANAMFASKQYNGCFALMDMTRAALAVAEPILREEVALLREALKPFADRLDELEKSPLTKHACAAMVEVEHLRAARAAIREGKSE